MATAASDEREIVVSETVRYVLCAHEGAGKPVQQHSCYFHYIMSNFNYIKACSVWKAAAFPMKKTELHKYVYENRPATPVTGLARANSPAIIIFRHTQRPEITPSLTLKVMEVIRRKKHLANWGI